ncbi:MAG: hypothetical protein ABR562_08160 [Thermoplasmatota archaeon]
MAWRVLPLLRTGILCGLLYALLLWAVHDGLDGTSSAVAWTVIAVAAVAAGAVVYFMEVPGAAPLWLVAWALAAFALVRADVLWPLPDACSQQGHFCEGVGLDRLVVVVLPVFLLPGSLFGVLAKQWRSRTRPA